MRSELHFLSALCVAVLALLFATHGCDTNPQSSRGPVDIGTLDDWIAFDESSYYAISAKRYGGEPYYNGDYVIGEPFTDVNGNGVFDEGIDIFTMSMDSTNMDLNDNGKYDGPDDPWSSGIPYDDLNGNGLYDDPHMNINYDPGDPFLDLNGNGVRDSRSTYAVVHWLNYDTYITATRWCVEYCDSAGLYTSDMGREYYLPTVKDDYWWDYWLDRPRRDTTLVFDLSDSGLTLISHRHNSLLHVLPPGDLVLGSSRVLTPHGGIGDSTSFLRSVSRGEQLEIHGKTYDDLLCVKFENAWPDNDSIRVSPDHDWELYFARDHGVMAVHTPSQWYYFSARFDSLPLPVTRWSWNEGDPIEPSPDPTPFPLSEGCKWTYVIVMNGLPQWELDTLEVEVVGVDSLPNGTQVVCIANSLVAPYAHVTDDGIEWYDDLADDDPECTWQLPFEVGNELGDCGTERDRLSFRRIIARDDSPGTYSTFGDCWKLETDITLYQVHHDIGEIMTLGGHAWLAEGVGMVEFNVDSTWVPPYNQRGSLGFVLIDFQMAP